MKSLNVAILSATLLLTGTAFAQDAMKTDNAPVAKVKGDGLINDKTLSDPKAKTGMTPDHMANDGMKKNHTGKDHMNKDQSKKDYMAKHPAKGDGLPNDAALSDPKSKDAMTK